MSPRLAGFMVMTAQFVVLVTGFLLEPAKGTLFSGLFIGTASGVCSLLNMALEQWDYAVLNAIIAVLFTAMVL